MLDRQTDRQKDRQTDRLICLLLLLLFHYQINADLFFSISTSAPKDKVMYPLVIYFKLSA